jgi:pyruvate dehydrogenase E2 component (dihydrolipoamide acetyltransferase)
MANAIVMPKAGNTVEECLLSSWRVKVGDTIQVGDIICEIETDKSSIEVEATAAGSVLALFWQEGDLVPVLQNILAVGTPGEDFSALAPAGATASSGDDEKTPVAAAAVADSDDATDSGAAAAQDADSSTAVLGSTAAQGPLSPRARKFVAEHPFVLPALTGSGAGGRIMEKDVAEAYRNAPRLSSAAAALRAEGVAAPAAGTGLSGMIRAEDMGKAAPAAPAVAAVSPFVDQITEKPFPQIRKIIAKRLHESLSSMAQYTLNAEAEVTGLLALRQRIKEQGSALNLANINIGDMVMFAVIKTLQQHPEFNAEFSDNVLRMHSAINIGFACDTPRGLMVPVLHNAQAMSLGEMSNTVKSLAKQANEGNLNPDLMSGATFTVSNLGALGISSFTPVINAPQVAILGVCKSILRPVRDAKGEVSYRDFMQFSLTLNHMAIDGAPGARFLQTLKGIVENFELICIAG